MGINIENGKFEQFIINSLNMEWNNIVMCELGDQVRKDINPHIIAKDYYVQKLKVKTHVSIDIHGKNGALPLNLENPVPENLINKFNLITDYGTSEHVNNQYALFNNIHDLCQMGGLMIHANPSIGNWPNHCRYYYTEDFYHQLCDQCGYIKVQIKTTSEPSGKRLVQAAFIKGDKNFISLEEFNNIPLLDTKDTRKTSNYTKKYRLWGR